MELTIRQRLLFLAYKLAWYIGLLLILVYFWWKGKKEPLYRQFLTERFGFFTCKLDRPIWIHAASLGELRGIMPLIDKILSAGIPLLLTTLTPAGRLAATQRYAHAFQSEVMQISYLPLEFNWAVRLFARNVQPRCMLSSEIDTWPVLLEQLKFMGIPLGFVNAQYPQKSFDYDKKWAGFRAAFFRAYDLVLCKSSLHAERFLLTGCTKVHVVGELRFDLPKPHNQIDAGRRLLEQLKPVLGQRSVMCLASMVDEEEELLINSYSELLQECRAGGLPEPLLIVVPRSPQRFDAVARLLQTSGLTVLRRSEYLSADFQLINPYPPKIDVVLGDSMGEMYFYLSMANTVTVCGSFVPLGSHNIIEPLTIYKSVIVGPSIWGIEYPAQEALAAKVIVQVQDVHELKEQWKLGLTSSGYPPELNQTTIDFMKIHSGSLERHWRHLQAWLT